MAELESMTVNPKPVDGEPEFWTILKSPADFRKRLMEDEMAELFAAELQKEIDNEIIENLVMMALEDQEKCR